MCYQACPYQQQFSLLCPHSSLSAASRLIKLPRLYHSERWLTVLEKVLIFKCVTSFFFWGQSLKHQLCVWCESGFMFVCVCGWMCVTEWGLVLIRKCFFQTKQKSSLRHTHLFLLCCHSRGDEEESEKRIRRMKRVERGEWWWYHNKCFH